MSRKAINILFIVGSCLYVPEIAMIIWGYTVWPHSVDGPSNEAIMYFLVCGVILISIGSIMLLVSHIGALIEMKEAQEWDWFTMLIILGWIVLFLYLIVGPKPKTVQKFG